MLSVSGTLVSWMEKTLIGVGCQVPSFLSHLPSEGRVTVPMMLSPSQVSVTSKTAPTLSEMLTAPGSPDAAVPLTYFCSLTLPLLSVSA